MNDPAARTPVFVRFSTVAGSRGSADSASDVRGFATKFYTDVFVIAPLGGFLSSSKDAKVPVAKTNFNTQSLEFDAVVLADGSGLDAFAADPRARAFFQEAFMHCKTIATWGRGAEVLSGFELHRTLRALWFQPRPTRTSQPP